MPPISLRPLPLADTPDIDASGTPLPWSGFQGNVEAVGGSDLLACLQANDGTYVKTIPDMGNAQIAFFLEDTGAVAVDAVIASVEVTIRHRNLEDTRGTWPGVGADCNAIFDHLPELPSEYASIFGITYLAAPLTGGSGQNDRANWVPVNIPPPIDEAYGALGEGGPGGGGNSINQSVLVFTDATSGPLTTVPSTGLPWTHADLFRGTPAGDHCWLIAVGFPLPLAEYHVESVAVIVTLAGDAGVWCFNPTSNHYVFAAECPGPPFISGVAAPTITISRVSPRSS